METIAVIPAGGEGKRFKPYTDIIPKPMIPVGPEEKPLLEHIITWLAKHNIKKIVLLVGYRWKQIANYFRDGRTWGVEITYSIDTPQYSGTGGALLNAYKQNLLDRETILVWYGDIIALLDPQNLLEKHREWAADATIALADKYQVPVGIAEVDKENNIIELEEKPWLPVKATIGILALETKTLPEAEKELGTDFDIMADLIPWMIKTNKRVKAYIYKNPWYDIGSIERYTKLDENLFSEFLNTTPP